MYSPSSFCLPLYLSLYQIITDKDQYSKDEIEECLKYTKISIGSSKEKELLLKTVENLAHTSEKIYNLKNMDSK